MSANTIAPLNDGPQDRCFRGFLEPRGAVHVVNFASVEIQQNSNTGRRPRARVEGTTLPTSGIRIPAPRGHSGDT